MPRPFGNRIRAALSGFVALLTLTAGGTALAGDRLAPPDPLTRAPKAVAPRDRPTIALIHGTIERLEYGGTVAVLRLPPIRPVCRVGQPCPQFIMVPAPVAVHLGKAVFDTAAGIPTSRPALRVGLLLYAAGHYAPARSSKAVQAPTFPLRVFDARVASVS